MKRLLAPFIALLELLRTAPSCGATATADAGRVTAANNNRLPEKPMTDTTTPAPVADLDNRDLFDAGMRGINPNVCLPVLNTYWGSTEGKLWRAALGRAPTAAARDVLAERRRQVEAEGWTPEHDAAHDDASMARAAACYAAPQTAHEFRDHIDEVDVSGGRGETPVWRAVRTSVPKLWPGSWAAKWWKPKDRRRDLVRAGALILAEIERLDRAGQVQGQGEDEARECTSCDWKGTTDRMLGAIGPLCPDCGDTTEQSSAQKGGVA